MRSNTVVLTNMVMIQDPLTGHVVVQDRVRGGWEGITFPGGHVDPGESVYDSAIREVREETGLIIHNPKLCGLAHWVRGIDDARNIVFLYQTREFEGDLIEATGEGPVYWIPIEDIYKKKLSQNFDVMLEVFLKPELQEAFAPWIEGFLAPMRVL